MPATAKKPKTVQLDTKTTAGRRQAAVLVAKDVLKQLRYLKPTSGTYISPRHGNALYPHYAIADGEPETTPFKTDNDQVQPHISKLTKDCEVCALGAAALSYCRLYNQLTVAQLRGGKWRPKLRAIFGEEGMMVIEHAFEGEVMQRRYPNPRDRLRYIMLNIVKNNGKYEAPL